ncbi:MAG: DEAD/DEAH box helicase [Oscillospiraceae bacterium]|nr:DEAD/DEAH box helicase [Oscillospiraceae bacterium]
MLDEEVFEYYAPFIREFIYKSGWEELREVQIEAGKTIYGSENNMLLCAGTATGKTEAVFFPIISQMVEDPPSSVGVIYIAPLKSLINDQFIRLDALLEEAEIPVFHWHGDVTLSHKSKMLKSPKGILQITPESLESMLINRSNDLPRIFGDLRYVVIDEIHTMPGVDRGNQIICILQRLEKIIEKSPRRFGLSATVGAPEEIAKWMSQGSQRECDIIQIKSAKTKWRLAINHFYVAPQADSTASSMSLDEQRAMVGGGKNNNIENMDGIIDDMNNFGDVENLDELNNLDNEAFPEYDKFAEFIKEDEGFSYMYDCATEKKSLIFTNSREEAEFVTATMREIAKHRGEDDIFYIHHGDLSAAIREEAELVLKDEEKPAVGIATVTMELGVDIGRLERVIQVSSPNTISNFLQRLGRSGRRGDPSEMIMIFREEEPLPTAITPKLIPWEMLKAIAVTQLYIEEKFIEPPNMKKLPFSLLYHQTMSFVASHGEITPKALADEMLNISPFKGVSREQFKELLFALLQNDHLQFTEDGREKSVIIGLKGERIINSFKFYAVFQDVESLTVKCESKEIGTITKSPPEGERFALAGRTWEVIELDLKRKIIYVKPVEGKMTIDWPGEYGVIHTKIVERIRRILEEDTIYPYLLESAQNRLKEARDIVRKTNLFKYPLAHLGGYSYAFFPWLGTVSFRTLRRYIKVNMAKQFKISNLEFDGCYYFEFKMEKGTDYDFIKYMYDDIKRNGIDKEELVGLNEDFAHEKYDEYIPKHLLRDAFISDNLRTDEIEVRIGEYLGMY